MSDPVNESTYRDEIDQESRHKNAPDINVCSWCKEQVESGEVDNHVNECGLIPSEEKARILKTNSKPTEVIHGVDRRK